MKKGTKFIIKMITSVIIAIIGAVSSFIVGKNTGYSEGFGDGQISIQEETIEKLEGVKNIEGENINVYYNATLNNMLSESEDYKSLTSKLEEEKQVLEDTVSGLQSESSKLKNELSALSEENARLKRQSTLTESSPEPAHQSLTPLSSANLVRAIDADSYIINSDYNTQQGNHFEKNFKAKSGGIFYDETLSISAHTPFELIYNLEGKFKTLSGSVGFDDLSPAEHFSIQVIFSADNGEKAETTISTTELPTDFFINVQDAKKLTISFSYTHNPLDNSIRYYDIINAFLE